MGIEFSHTLLNRSDFARLLEREAARVVSTELHELTAEIEDEIEGIISHKLHERDGYRAKEGDEKLQGSIRVEIDHDGSFPVTITVTSDADEGKVAALELGARPHGIDGNPYLVFPSNRISNAKSGQSRGVFGRGFQATGRGKNFASFNAPKGFGSRGGTGKKLTKVTHVDHPGNPGFHFMRDGLERVIRRRLQGARL